MKLAPNNPNQPEFTIIIKNGIVETVLSHTGKQLVFNVIDYDLLGSLNQNALHLYENNPGEFKWESEQNIPLSELDKEL